MRGGLVLLTTPGESANAVFSALESEFGVDRVIFEEPVSRLHLLRRRVRRFGRRRVGSQLLFQLLISPLLQARSRSRIFEIRKRGRLLGDSPPPARVLRVPSANEPSTLELLMALQPRVVVVHGTRILSEALLRSITAKFVNIHAGITPAFRGVHGAYWALASGRPDLCGVTVHLVDAGIDTGQVLAQTLITPENEDNFVTYPWLQLEAGIPLLITAVRRLLDGSMTDGIEPLTKESRLWSHPTFCEYVRFFRKGVK